MEKSRVIYIDILRILACFGVIVIQVSEVGLADYKIGSQTWVLRPIYNSLFRWSVPVFYDKRCYVLGIVLDAILIGMCSYLVTIILKKVPSVKTIM